MRVREEKKCKARQCEGKKDGKKQAKIYSALLSRATVNVTKANQTDQLIAYDVDVTTVYPVPLRLCFLIPTKPMFSSRPVEPSRHGTG